MHSVIGIMLCTCNCVRYAYVPKENIQMVRPVLEYASAVWVNCRKQDSLMLEKVQLQVAHAARHGCKALSKMENQHKD